MDFVTIHELSRELDKSARVIRYHLMRLIAAEKLKEDQDYRKEDYKDALHFEWKINPISFMRESGLTPNRPVPKVANEMASDLLSTDNKVANEPVINPPPVVNQPTLSVNNPPPVVNQPVNQSDEIVALHREMITAFKEQIHVKDEQIRELTKQNRDVGELNLKLNSALLQQAIEIKTLLHLTGGRMDSGDVVTESAAVVNKSVNHTSTLDNDVANETSGVGSSPESAMAA